MSTAILQLLRPHIAGIKPYTSARAEYSGEGAIMLDANENPYGSVLPDELNRYPDPLQKKLKEKLAILKGVSVDQTFLGNGSDEPIDLLIRAFCEPGKDNIIILPPTYGMYVAAASINNVETRTANLLPGFQPDISAIHELTDNHTKILFICSPNNPTGNAIHSEEIKVLLDTFPGVVVIDEAYIDFSEHKSWLQHLDQYPNLVVLQTFSKAWGMASIRLGMAYTQPALIDILNKMKAPYNISGITQSLALEALDKEVNKNAFVREILAQRAILAYHLSLIEGVEHVFPSDANFLLIRVKNADKLYQYLTEKGVVVRNRSREPLCENCLRVTVGNSLENEQLLRHMGTFSC